jgi:hypothetical protein
MIFAVAGRRYEACLVDDFCAMPAVKARTLEEKHLLLGIAEGMARLDESGRASTPSSCCRRRQP